GAARVRGRDGRRPGRPPRGRGALRGRRAFPGEVPRPHGGVPRAREDVSPRLALAPGDHAQLRARALDLGRPHPEGRSGGRGLRRVPRVGAGRHGRHGRNRAYCQYPVTSTTTWTVPDAKLETTVTLPGGVPKRPRSTLFARVTPARNGTVSSDGV